MTALQWAELSFLVAALGIPVYALLMIWDVIREWRARRRARRTLAAINAAAHAYLIHGTGIVCIKGNGDVEHIDHHRFYEPPPPSI